MAVVLGWKVASHSCRALRKGHSNFEESDFREEEESIRQLQPAFAGHDQMDKRNLP